VVFAKVARMDKDVTVGNQLFCNEIVVQLMRIGYVDDANDVGIWVVHVTDTMNVRGTHRECFTGKCAKEMNSAFSYCAHHKRGET